MANEYTVTLWGAVDQAADPNAFISYLGTLIDYCIKELLSDSEWQDDMIFVFLAEMSYSAKVTALMNLYGQLNDAGELELSDKLADIEKQLPEAG